jgi:hypothetical protein
MCIMEQTSRKCVGSYPRNMTPLSQPVRLLHFLMRVFKFFTLTSPSLTVLSICIFIATSNASAEIVYDVSGGGTLTRQIEIKQGKLVGLRFQFTSNPHLKPVEVFLGIPYAAAPTGSQRFMPPGSPPQWMGVKSAHNFGPVCPQNLPDLNERNRNTMSDSRARYLRRLFPYLLHNQSEDCLYLNIYAPAQNWGEYRNRTSSSIVALCVMRL